MSEREEYGPATLLAHGGGDPFARDGFVNPATVRGSTVLFPDARTLRARDQAYTYGTSGTPTTRTLCEMVNAMEGTEGTVLTPSGLAALSLPLLALLSPGDHFLCVDSVYTPTRRICGSLLRRMGVEVEFYHPSENGDIARRMKANTRLVHVECPASNTFEVQDVRAVADAAHAAGALVSADNTYATALLFKPIDHGVDVVVHAATKYPNGHSDVLMGFVSASGEAWEAIRLYDEVSGNCVSPDDASLVLRGLRTMPLRLQHHGESALEIAGWLRERDGVLDVLHPGLPSHPDHDLFTRQFAGSSGIFSFVLDGDAAAADRFLDATPLFGLGYSWAGYRSLAVPPNLTDRTIAHGPERGTVVRLQIGLEDVDDLKRDLSGGLEAALQP